ncbi:MAG: hypothetical protein GY756_06740 [bacterium]|nr:hypothetical protein [bacterium]
MCKPGSYAPTTDLPSILDCSGGDSTRPGYCGSGEAPTEAGCTTGELNSGDNCCGGYAPNNRCWSGAEATDKKCCTGQAAFNPWDKTCRSNGGSADGCLNTGISP